MMKVRLELALYTVLQNKKKSQLFVFGIGKLIKVLYDSTFKINLESFKNLLRSPTPQTNNWERTGFLNMVHNTSSSPVRIVNITC